MIGKLLSQSEILHIKNKTMVWVVDIYNFYDSRVCIKNKDTLEFVNPLYPCCYYIGEGGRDSSRVKVYEYKE